MIILDRQDNICCLDCLMDQAGFTSRDKELPENHDALVYNLVHHMEFSGTLVDFLPIRIPDKPTITNVPCKCTYCPALIDFTIPEYKDKNHRV